MQRGRTAAIAALVVASLAVAAFAHGGTYQPPPPESEPPPSSPPPSPPPPPPPGKSPTVPVAPPDAGPPPSSPGPDAGPSTPSGDPPTGGGPTTGGGGGGGPTTGGSPPSPPTPPDPRRKKGKGAGGIAPEHWTRWWYANRLTLHDRSGRVEERQVRTPGAEDRKAPVAEIWRAASQEALIVALSDGDDDVASGAAVALGKAGDPNDAAPLIAVLGNAQRSQETREAAALALGLLGPGDGAEKARRALEVAAADERSPERLRAFAVYAMGLSGEAAAVPFLIDSAQSDRPSWDVPAAGATALGLSRCGPAREDLERILEGPKRDRSRDTMRRVYAAHGLARLGDAAAVPALLGNAEDDDVDVRRAVVLALGVLARADDTDASDCLVHLLRQDKDRAVRSMSMIALGRTRPPRALKELRWAYDNGDSLEQPFAALGLGLLLKETKDADTLKSLRRELDVRGSSDLKGALAIALGLAGDLESAPLLRKIAEGSGDPEIRAQCAMALGLVGDRANAPPVLRRLLADSGSPVMQREAAFALGMLGDAEAVKILLALVADGSSVYVQGSAAVALGRIGGAESAEALRKLLADRSRPGIARAMAAVALGLVLDRTEGRRLAAIGADLDWYALTPAVREILDIL